MTDLELVNTDPQSKPEGKITACARNVNGVPREHDKGENNMQEKKIITFQTSRQVRWAGEKKNRCWEASLFPTMFALGFFRKLLQVASFHLPPQKKKIIITLEQENKKKI